MSNHAEQLFLDLFEEIGVDLFAGAGGVSAAYEMAFGHSPHLAINHSDDALSMHCANHPFTKHWIADVREVDPRVATDGRPVGILHLSPDCTHFSQAKAGQPRDKRIRALSWTGIHWAGTVLPRQISLENVESIIKWGPLIAKRDPATKRVVKRDGSVAGVGERVPLSDQFLVPDPKRAGQTWKRFVSLLKRLGYTVEWRRLNAANYGAGTVRSRLIMLARRDGQPLVWPAISHSANGTSGTKPWVPASASIDFSLPGKSIFGRARPLADATLRRIARGVEKFVVTAGDPFIIPIAHYNGSNPAHSVHEPLRTITAWPRGGAFALVTAQVVRADGSDPVVYQAAYLMQANGGYNTTVGHDLTRPMSTITSKGSQQQLVSAVLVPVERTRSEAMQTTARNVSEFYARWLDMPTQDYLEVAINGSRYIIVDILLRMLEPRELFRAQGFPAEYVINRGHDKRRFTKAVQVKMCGNSVPPPLMLAVFKANYQIGLPLAAAA